MSDGALHLAEITYPTGEIRFRFAFVLAPDGVTRIRHGRFVEYSRTGSVISEGSYENGLEEGVWRDIHENGPVAAKGRYTHGKENGVWQFWGEDGRQEPDVVYRDGVALSP